MVMSINLLILVFAVVVNSCLLVWLLLEHRRLQREHRALRDFVQRNNQDIAGLCSAAVSVDKHLRSNAQQILELLDKIGHEQHTGHEQPDQPYRHAIQSARSGADIDELIQDYGLSHDEAVLLIRLHVAAHN